MRFEKMGYQEKQKRLRQIQVRLNNGLFNGELKIIPVNIENLDSSVWAGYKRPCTWFPDGKIMIDHDYIDIVVSKTKTIKEQTYLLSLVILHEMIHQYCYEHKIDDKDHGHKWQKIAEGHGLESIWENGEKISEQINSRGLVTIANL